MKKSILLALCILLAASLSLGSTIAYLQDSDNDVNVMTLGNVKIDQLEQQRVNGELADFTSIEGSTEYISLFPGVYADAEPAKDADDKYYAASVSNAVDKIVSVKNTGKSPAYVRTIFAFEMGSMDADRFNEIMKINWQTEPTLGEEITIKGKNYMLYEVVYPDALAAGSETAPSLLQVLLSKDANNDDMKALDAEEDGYRILVTSQGVQTAGFDNAEQALNEAFGEISQDNHPWAVTKVSTAEALMEALKYGGEIELTDHITLGKDSGDVQSISIGSDVTLDTRDNIIRMFNTELNIEEGASLNLESTTNQGKILMDKSSSLINHGTMNVSNIQINTRGNALKTYGKMVLGKDVNIELDLQSAYFYPSVVNVGANGDLLIKDDATICLKKTDIPDDGEKQSVCVYVGNGGKAELRDNAVLQGYDGSSYVVKIDNGEFVMNGGLIESRYGVLDQNGTSGRFEMNDGTIRAIDVARYSVVDNSWNVFIMNGGLFEVEGSIHTAINNWGGNFTMNDGEIKISAVGWDGALSAVQNNDEGTVIQKGGKITVKLDSADTESSVYSVNTGGTFYHLGGEYSPACKEDVTILTTMNE